MSGEAPQGPRLPLRKAAALGAAVGALLALLSGLGVFHEIDLRLHDLRYRLRGPQPASPRIALVEIDDATLAGFQGAWPLPRENHALLLDALTRSGAQAIGFDLLFLGAQEGAPTGDLLLASLTQGREDVVHAITFVPEDDGLDSGTSASSQDLPELIRHGRPVTRQRLAVARQVALPYPMLLDAARSLGHTSVAVDEDGVVRRVPQFVRHGEWAYPSLALRIVECAARNDSTLPQFELAEDGLREHWHGRVRRVPTDAEGTTSIAFAGDRASFPHRYSMLRVLQWYRDGDTTSLARAFRGKLVLVGVTAQEQVATDIGATPYAAAAPLVYIHANAVNAALQGRFVAHVSPWAMAPLVLLVALVAALAFAWLPLLRGASVALGGTLLLGVADLAVFTFADLDVPPTGLLLAPVLTWLTIEAVWRTLAERRAAAHARELQVARTIQQQMLPSTPPRSEVLDVAGLNEPADAIGGDYFDWVPVGGDQLALVVADVSGHGIPAALLMAHLRASFHAEAKPGVAPEAIVAAVNQSLTRAAAPGKFATFFLALISLREETLTFANAGHNPPLLLHDGELELLEATGIPLAMMEGLPYTGGTRRFAPGDTLVLYSDGVPEAPSGPRFYGDDALREQARALVAEGRDARGIVDGLLADVRRFAGAGLAADDVTLVVARRR